MGCRKVLFHIVLYFGCYLSTYAENDPGIVILRPVNAFISLLRISNAAPVISFFSLPWYFSSKSSLLQIKSLLKKLDRGRQCDIRVLTRWWLRCIVAKFTALLYIAYTQRLVRNWMRNIQLMHIMNDYTHKMATAGKWSLNCYLIKGNEWDAGNIDFEHGCLSPCYSAHY